MLSEERRNIAAFFDECARRGDMADFPPEDEERLGDMMETWDLRPGEKVLEVGCGCGRLSARLAPLVGERGEIVAVDLSPRMIRKARMRSLPAHVRFVEGDVAHLDCPDGWFDCALCFCVLPHLRPLAPALAEIGRAVRPGGGLWVCHLMSSAQINAFHRHAGTVVADHRLPELRILREALGDAGFEILSLEDGEARGFRLHARRQGGR